MSHKTVIVLLTAAALTGGLTADAFARGGGGGGGGHGGGFGGGGHMGGRFGGFAGHRFAISHGFVRPFRRNFAFRRGRRTFATGGLWPYYGYDYFPTDAYGDINGTTYPETVGFVPEPPPAPVCHRSEETFTVPSEGGGTRQIKIINCP
jgi:hypothetical protein